MSSSEPSISVILPAIHLRLGQHDAPLDRMQFSLLHDFHVDLLHVHLLTEIRRELRLPKQLLIHRGSHRGEQDWL